MLSLVILALACSYASVHGQTTTARVCNAAWCNPDHQPFPNIFATMTGYNIVRGNPFAFSRQHDPGFATSYIFRATELLPGGKYGLHKGISVRQVVRCDLSLRTDSITNVKEYQDTMAKQAASGVEFASNLETEVSAEVKGVGVKTKKPPLVEAAFSASSEYRDNLKFFSQLQGVLTMNDATCTTYTVHVSSYNPPQFTKAFETSLEELHAATSQSEAIKDREFKMFIDNFGTHFIEQATMGARLAISRRYQRSEYQRATDNDVKECNSFRLKLSMNANIGGGSNKCQNVQTDTKSSINNTYEREYISSYGSKPAKDLVEWSQQTFDAPLPIKMKLSPILNLFQSGYMKKYEPKIDYKAILRWLAPKYVEYCNTYKSQLGVESCSAETNKGCGWNDNCQAKTQQCINNPLLPNGYKCCQLACMSSPCQNGAKCVDKPNCDYTCACPAGVIGKSCNVRTIVQSTLSTEVLDYLRAHQRSTNDQVRDTYTKQLQNTYGTLYYMTLLVYNPISGGDNHWIRGYYVHHFRQFGKNIVVSWVRRDSLMPSSSRLASLKTQLRNALTNRGCNTQDIVNKAWPIATSTGFPVRLVASVRFGHGLRYSAYAPGNIFLNFVCKTSTSWGKTTRHETSLVVSFGQG